jgi:hypothetical protein
VRRQHKELGKLCELDGEPLAIGHPHKDPLFLIEVESEVKLCDDLLIPAVAIGQKVGDAMELTCFQNPIEVHILFVLHVV